MNIWQISTRRDENIFLTAKEKEYKKLDCFLCGESMADRWNPTLSLYVDEKRTNVAYSDALSFAAAYFVLSERALKIFQDFAGDTIECLTFQCRQEGYLIVNPIEFVDCLDMERSEYKVYKGAPDKIQFYTKLCFVKGDLEGKHLFRIKHMDEYLVACSDAFKEALESAGMIGFQFKKLSDEIVSERAPEGSIRKEGTNAPKKQETTDVYKIYNNKVVDFIRSPKRFATDKNLEAFYELIDELEKLAKEDKKYYNLLSTCYEQVGDFCNALRCFEQVYNSKDKKAMKRHSYLSHTRMLVRIRPGKRCKKLPQFRYVAKKELKDYFIPAKTGEKCCICGKENIDFYVGYAYEDGELIVFSEDRERFCSDCLVTGRAAGEKNIIFNNDLIKDMSDMTEEQRHTLLYCTPGVSHNFDTNEDIWPVCCDDYCCYMGSDSFSVKFQCVECGKKISWKYFT